MRVVSMVPSWTETLLACGAQVVGRTRFCIHPSQGLAKIPAVGGTKDWKLESVSALKPDLILLDREENPISMAKTSPAEYFATHIRSLSDVGIELSRMSEKFREGGDIDVANKLAELAKRWNRVDQAPPLIFSVEGFPGVIKWIRQPVVLNSVVYVIWKKPWMAAAQGTFIESVLAKLGIKELLPNAGTKYPEFMMESLPPNTLLLFSSEPFPFEREFDKIRELDFPSALVDGESFSWFGLRSLKFLEAALGL